jgi:hypothetical protein
MPNEPLGWLLILIGFLVGGWMGMNFERAVWLGGYASFERRMVRLGHIAMIALGGINVLFAQSCASALWGLSPEMTTVASWGFMVGAVAMPACCFLTAWKRRLLILFPVPVFALLLAAALTFWGTVRR